MFQLSDLTQHIWLILRVRSYVYNFFIDVWLGHSRWCNYSRKEDIQITGYNKSPIGLKWHCRTKLPDCHKIHGAINIIYYL